MVNRGLVGCIAPHISEDGVGVIIKVDFFIIISFFKFDILFLFICYLSISHRQSVQWQNQ